MDMPEESGKSFKIVLKLLCMNKKEIQAREAEDSKRLVDGNCEKSGENEAEVIVSYIYPSDIQPLHGFLFSLD